MLRFKVCRLRRTVRGYVSDPLATGTTAPRELCLGCRVKLEELRCGSGTGRAVVVGVQVAADLRHHPGRLGADWRSLNGVIA